MRKWIQLGLNKCQECVIPENIHTHSMESYRNFWREVWSLGVGESFKAKILKESAVWC